MISNDLGKDLHDRSTRGEQLADDEQGQLDSWYEYQDNLEDNILGTGAEKKTITKLQSQIEVALTQLIAITNRIQEVASENETLRQEISSLRHQLVDSSTLQQSV
jgi:predicted  nucleic acid-binding Zn-ribbon protein